MSGYRKKLVVLFLAFATSWGVLRIGFHDDPVLRSKPSDRRGSPPQMVAAVRSVITIPKFISTPFNAVTNETLRDLIAAGMAFRGSNLSVAQVIGHKDYTAAVALPEQQDDLRRLYVRSGGTLQAYLRTNISVPVQLKGHPLASPNPAIAGQTDANELAALTFLTDNRALFRLRQPEVELRLTHREADALGRTVLRFAQFFHGMEVWPGEIGVHVDPVGAIDLVHSTSVPTPENLDLTPKILASQATALARANVLGGMAGAATQPTLLIYAPLDQTPKLAWKFELGTGLEHQWQCVVDAHSGALLKSVDLCLCASVGGSGVDLLGITRLLNVDQQGATYYLRDKSKPMFNPSATNGLILITDARNASKDQVIVNNTIANTYYVTSSSPTSWTVPDTVSAAFNLSQTYDYYLERFGRNSFNDKGSNLIATVRIGGLANAFWNPAFQRMFFGNADRYAAALDVIGHEVTHGVVGSIGDQGVLGHDYQPGALNEAFADIFGEMVDARSKGGLPDWIIGSVLNQTVRNMSNPAALNVGGAGNPYPQKMSQFINTTSDQGGVHFNSTIISHAYYLIASGLSGNVGITDAEKVFYRCLTTKLLPQSQFIDTRLGCIASAEELFGVGSSQALKVSEGFDAIELFAAPTTFAPSPTELPPVSAPDSTMLVYFDGSISDYSLARYEAALGDPANAIRIATHVKTTRPAVTGAGTSVAYVTSANTLALQDTAGGNPSYYAAGSVFTMTFSPLGDNAAFVLLNNGAPANQIVLLDFSNSSVTTLDLLLPVYDDAPINNITAAGAMSFSPDGKTLAFTAQSVVVDPDGRIFSTWSIYTLDVDTFTIRAIVPPSAEFQALQPFFSRTSSRYLLFEITINLDSFIYVADLAAGTFGYVGASAGGVARACFTGDDSAVIYRDNDSGALLGESLFFQPLTANKLAASGSRTRWFYNSRVGVTYRRGNYIGVNIPPTVAITSPANGAVFTSPASFSVAINASDSDGSIAKVELYDGNKLLITDTNSPFSGFTANNQGAGIRRYFARAYDNRGASTTSLPLRIAVQPSQGVAAFRSSGAKNFELALSTPTAGVYRVEASTNLIDWISLGSFESLSGLVTYADPDATNHTKRFYRAVKIP